MDNCLQTQNLPPVTDNKITLFYFFNKHVNVEKHGHETLKEIGFPTRIQELINKRLLKQALWTEHSYNITRDINKNIQALFHSKELQKPITTWKLNPQAIKILNGKQASKDKNAYARSGLVLELTSSSKNRLTTCGENDTTPQLKLEKILYHQFKTCFAVATIELSINNQNLSHHLVNETVYSLARFNNILWRNTEDTKETIQNLAIYSMGDLIRDLLAYEKKKRYKRVYTHTYIQLDGASPENEIKRYLSKLALHYNDEYHVSRNIQYIETVSNYENILHILAMEGAASCVNILEDSPEFLIDYKDKVITQVHIPIHLLTFHMEQAIQEYQTKAHIWIDEKGPDPKMLDRLQQHQQQLLNFDLNFFNPVISNIDSHNQLYHSLVGVKKLKEQHFKITRNSQIISKLINDDKQQQEEANTKERNFRYCEIAQLGVAAAGYLTSFSILKEGLEVREHEHWLNDVLPSFTTFLDTHIGAISLFGSLIIAFIIYAVTRWHCAHAEEHHEHSPTDHALHALHTRHVLNDHDIH